MPTATTPFQSACHSRRTTGTDNRQVLEFLELVDQLKQVAELLAIEPAGPKGSSTRQLKPVPST